MRDQRAKDNWALLHALNLSFKYGVPAAVVFNMVGAVGGWSTGSWDFWLGYCVKPGADRADRDWTC